MLWMHRLQAGLIGSKTALSPVMDASVWMMWSLSLSKYVKTGSVVSIVLIFLNAVCYSDSQGLDCISFLHSSQRL